MDEINLFKLLDFIDEKIQEVRHNDTLPFMAKITAYNILIDLQGFIKDQQDEKIEENRRKDGKTPTYI